MTHPDADGTEGVAVTVHFHQDLVYVLHLGIAELKHLR